MKTTVLIVFALALVAGCDKLKTGEAPNRFELSKDAEGRTIRLDKQTGEIAVIKDEQIVNLKDAATLEKEQSTVKSLGEPKERLKIDVAQYGVFAQLSTAWVDGSILYNFNYASIERRKELLQFLEERKKHQAEIKANPSAAPPAFPKMTDTQRQAIVDFLGHTPLTIEFMDANGFALETFVIDSGISRVVDDEGKVESVEARSKRPMSRAVYERIAGWNLRWRQ